MQMAPSREDLAEALEQVNFALSSLKMQLVFLSFKSWLYLPFKWNIYLEIIIANYSSYLEALVNQPFLSSICETTSLFV